MKACAFIQQMPINARKRQGLCQVLGKGSPQVGQGHHPQGSTDRGGDKQ